MGAYTSKAWRLSLAVSDVPYLLRKACGRTDLFDVVFISNCRDDRERLLFFGQWPAPVTHVECLRLRLGGVRGQLRGLAVTARELADETVRAAAQEKFIQAARWARDHGAKVILLAAGTKRLFGHNGEALKQAVPGVLFTIGDNGTCHLLNREVLSAFEKLKLSPRNARVAVLGPYGIVGEAVTRELVCRGFTVIGAGPNAKQLDRIRKQYMIPVCDSLAEIGKVDAVIACTHSESVRLTANAVRDIRRPGRRLLVVDMAEPANFSRREYAQSGDLAIRLDAGNAHSRDLKYALLGHKMLGLASGVTFGCFAEALCLAAAIKRGEAVHDRDWFTVSKKSMRLVGELFDREGVGVPPPHCFGTPVPELRIDTSTL